MEKKLTEKQKAALKKGREALKKKQASAKKAVRKELSKTKKSIKKTTSKIMTTAKTKAAKSASKKMDSLKKRLHKKGLAGNNWPARHMCLMLENNNGDFYNWLYQACLKKAKRGVDLSVVQLAESSTVKAEAKKWRKYANETCDFDTSLADEKEGRRMFAQNMIDAVMFDIQHSK